MNVDVIKPIEKKPIKDRVWEVDLLRGFLILFVVFDHFMWTVVFQIFGNFGWLTNFAFNYVDGAARAAVHGVFVAGFMLLSGVSTAFTRSNFKKSIRVLFFAFFLTWFTYIAEATDIMPEMIISFGILHVIGFSGLIWTLLEKIKMPAWVIIVFAVQVLFIGYYFVANPLTVAMSSKNLIFFIFVETSKQGTLSPMDYFPLLPWFGWFLVGVGVSKLLYKNKKTLFPKVNEKIVRPLTFCGRHSLEIYFLGVIGAVVLLFLISLMM